MMKIFIATVTSLDKHIDHSEVTEILGAFTSHEAATWVLLERLKDDFEPGLEIEIEMICNLMEHNSFNAEAEYLYRIEETELKSLEELEAE